MQILLFVVLIILYTGNLTMFSKQKFGECIPVTILSIPLVLLFSHLISGTFRIGYIIISLLALSCIPTAFYLRKKGKLVLDRIFTPGFLAFLFSFLFFCFMDYRRYFWAWDEMSHWGIMTKELIRMFI